MIIVIIISFILQFFNIKFNRDKVEGPYYDLALFSIFLFALFIPLSTLSNIDNLLFFISVKMIEYTKFDYYMALISCGIIILATRTGLISTTEYRNPFLVLLIVSLSYLFIGSSLEQVFVPLIISCIVLGNNLNKLYLWMIWISYILLAVSPHPITLNISVIIYFCCLLIMVHNFAKRDKQSFLVYCLPIFWITAYIWKLVLIEAHFFTTVAILAVALLITLVVKRKQSTISILAFLFVLIPLGNLLGFHYNELFILYTPFVLSSLALRRDESVEGYPRLLAIIPLVFLLPFPVFPLGRLVMRMLSKEMLVFGNLVSLVISIIIGIITYSYVSGYLYEDRNKFLQKVSFKTKDIFQVSIVILFSFMVVQISFSNFSQSIVQDKINNNFFLSIIIVLGTVMGTFLSYIYHDKKIIRNTILNWSYSLFSVIPSLNTSQKVAPAVLYREVPRQVCLKEILSNDLRTFIDKPMKTGILFLMSIIILLIFMVSYFNE